MVDGETSAPKLLTEADLIALMEKHGIGENSFFLNNSPIKDSKKERKNLYDNIDLIFKSY